MIEYNEDSAPHAASEEEPLYRVLVAGLDAIDRALAAKSEPGPDPEAVAREEPEEDWVRGTCPACGGKLVSNSYYVGGKGYILVWECWERLGEPPTCDYRRVL